MIEYVLFFLFLIIFVFVVIKIFVGFKWMVLILISWLILGCLKVNLIFDKLFVVIFLLMIRL